MAKEAVNDGGRTPPAPAPTTYLHGARFLRRDRCRHHLSLTEAPGETGAVPFRLLRTGPLVPGVDTSIWDLPGVDTSIWDPFMDSMAESFGDSLLPWPTSLVPASKGAGDCSPSLCLKCINAANFAKCQTQLRNAQRAFLQVWLTQLLNLCQ